MKHAHQPFGRWLALAGGVVIIDQASKLLVDVNMALHQSIPVLPGFNLTYVHNTGAAFSFLSGAGGWQRWLFAGLALIVCIALPLWLRRLKAHETLLACALSLVWGGAAGNLIDRLLYGYVIDFIDVYYQNWHWPAFNIADSAICIGVGLMMLESCGIGARHTSS